MLRTTKATACEAKLTFCQIHNLSVSENMPASATTPNMRNFAFSVQGQGEADSILQDGSEVLPSRLQEIFGLPKENQGLFGLLALVLIFAGGIFLKRAFDILAELAIPKPDQKK